MRRWLALLALSLVATGCGGDDPAEPTPYELCLADDNAACCADADCGAGALCDFSYICSPAPEGGMMCSGASGTHTCVPLCSEQGTCDAGLICVERQHFQGSDAGTMEHVCVAEPREGDTRVPRVGREDRAPYAIVWLAGSPYEMGYQHGQLLHDELARGVDALETNPLLKAMAILARNGGLIDLAESNSYDWLREECRGMADAAADIGWTYDDCLMLNFGDVLTEVIEYGQPEHVQLSPGCSQVIASGPATAEGGVLHGRTLDWAVIDYVVEHPVLLVRQPTGGVPHVIVGFPGNLSPYQGLNVHGVAIASNQVDPIDHTVFDVTGQSHVQAITEVLGRATSLAEARDALLGLDHMSFEALAVSSPEGGAVVELSPLASATRTLDERGLVFLTNHFQHADTDALDQEPPSASSRRRLTRLGQIFDPAAPASPYAALDVPALARVLRDRVSPETQVESGADVVDDGESLATNGALYMLILEPATLRFWVASGALPVHQQPFQAFSLADLLSLPGYPPAGEDIF